ncbi:hypothetical protein E4L95_20580 [Paracoccus liaowanqingii]|uniref:Alpha/beta hydrolase n=1 Tax=Paracoccus liaowanqingii TaxID=2560053 RepID=A0A4Z1C6W6_9RHOB|nr:YqiA/YcfP family alpha/beta fold hydrolase [Paracoccus liaowanqingii]TGN43397.1 hypothetical protein E4L95_20580 [Paracoccus liaowanqingii]
MGREYIRSIVYDGRDLCVIINCNNNKNGVITFGSWLRNPLENKQASLAKGFGDGVFINLKIDEMHVIPRTNHWYQSDEIKEVKKIAEIFLKSRNVISYGSSMGGYGAALLSATLGIKSVTLAPQFTLDKNLAPWEKRWENESKKIPYFDNMLMTKNGLASGFLFYDPFTKLDAMQAELYRLRSNLIFVPIPFSGHATASMVNKIYSLKRLVSDVLSNNFLASRFSEYRRLYSRRRDDTYLSMMYVYADSNGKELLSLWCLNQLEQIDGMIGAKALRTLSIHENRKNCLYRLDRWAHIAARLTPSSASDCLISAHIAAKGNYIKDAIRILEHGRKIAPNNIAFAREIDKLT